MTKNLKYWKFTHLQWGMLAACLLLLGTYYFDGLDLMVKWWEREEYSHGPLIPVICIFFIWQLKESFFKQESSGSWLGFVVLLLGLFIGLIGQLSTIYTVSQYGFLIALYGLVLAMVGWRCFMLIIVPLAILFFMIPLPNFLYFNLSQKLQLVSSAIGVEVTRLFGVSVFLEGNVIDLGNYKLQVVDACSGLRYLFPLMSFGFICAYLFKAPFWQRAVIFLSTIPITIFMNSFRIGVIGVLVDRWGTEQAEGFLHDFEGWVIFMACVATLFAEMWLFNKFLGKGDRELREVFGLEFPEPTPKGVVFHNRTLQKSFIASLIALFVGVLATMGIDEREEIVPERTQFAAFPEQLGEWKGDLGELEAVYLKGLGGLSDHTIGNFTHPDGDQVNFYAAYYESQRAGGSVHSPKSCIPGGGWVIQNIEQVALEHLQVAGQPVIANRVEIVKGEYKQLVYYWFQQRGRSISNEYLLKWFLFWDSLTKQRSDGSLVRLTTLMGPGEEMSEGDERIREFSKVLGDNLKGFIPE